MRIIRRFVFTAALLFATFLLVRAAREHGDFLFMFYPGILRELQAILAELTGQLDYLLWERIALIALIWAGITLLLDIILQENLLRWISGVTAVAALVLCLYVGLAGLNYYAPSVAEGMRLEVRDDYSVSELEQAAIYYRNGANRAAKKVDRDTDGLFVAPEFETLAEQVGSGMHNMIRTSYVFGGSTIAPKKLGYLARFDIPSFYSCFTGECCINPEVDDAAMPFLMSREIARRMSLIREGDAAFVAVLACIASDSPDYNYSGYLMAYRFCMDALTAFDETRAKTVAAGESKALTTDLAACSFMSEPSIGKQWVERMESLDKKELEVAERPEAPDLGALLVSWHIRLTTPAEPMPEKKPLAA